jgi:hypothetical protein
MSNIAAKMQSLPEQLEFSSDGFIESFESAEDSNAIVLEVLSLTPKYLERELIEEYGKTLEGKEVRWRHVQPELFTGSFLGTTLKTWVDGKGNLRSKIRIDGDTAEQKKAQEWIKEQMEKDEKVGISVGFIRIMDDDGGTTKVFFREQSVTPFPHCEECGAVKIVTNEGKDKDKDQNGEQPSQPDLGAHISLPPNFKGSLTLESEDDEEKDEKSKKDEKENGDKDKDEKMNNKEDADDDKDKKKKNEEKERQKMEKVEQLETVNKQLEAKVKEYEDKITSLNDKVIEMEVEREIIKSAPKRRRIAELEGCSSPDEMKTRMDELLQFDDRPGSSGKSQLDLMLESLEKAVSIARKESLKPGRSSQSPIVTSGRAAAGVGGKVTDTQLERMTPEQVLKSAGME